MTVIAMNCHPWHRCWPRQPKASHAKHEHFFARPDGTVRRWADCPGPLQQRQRIGARTDPRRREKQSARPAGSQAAGRPDRARGAKATALMPTVWLRTAARRDLVEHFVCLAENAGLVCRNPTVCLSVRCCTPRATGGACRESTAADWPLTRTAAHTRPPRPPAGRARRTDGSSATRGRRAPCEIGWQHGGRILRLGSGMSCGCC